MNSRKNFLAICLLIMVCITFFTVSTFAASNKRKTPIDLTKKTSDGNPCKDIDNLSKEGWNWDSKSKILTLKNFDLETSSSKNKFAIYLPANSKIKLIGTSKITSHNLSAISTKDNKNGNFTIYGSGSLEVYSDGTPSETIKLSSSQFTVKDCNLLLDSGNDYETIYDFSGKLNITLNNADVTCKSHNSEAINIYGKVELNNSTLSVQSEKGTGIYTQNGFVANKSNISVNSISSCGIATMGDVKLKNSDVKINSNNYNIYIGNDSMLTIYNCNLTTSCNIGKKIYASNENEVNIINSNV